MADYKQYFRQYKTNLSLLKLKEIEDTNLFREINEVKNPSVKAQVITDMPITHGEENSPVERFVVAKEKRLEELYAKRSKLQEEMRLIENEIIRCEACLDILDNKERYIIEQYYLEGLEWSLVSNAYQCKYQRWISVKQLIIIRNNAIDKIEKLLKSA